MRIVATHNGSEVIIVAFAYHGKDDAAVLKATYYDVDTGAVDHDDASNFVVNDRRVRPE